MNLVELTISDKGIKDYNKNIKRCIKEHPQHFSEKDLIESLDDLIAPYESVIADSECQKIISDVKDNLTDFKGVYMCSQLEHYIDYLNEKITDNDNFYFVNKYHRSCYGVADNASQVIEHFKAIESEMGIDFGNCVICLRPIRKDQQPSEGGWRWHKWGKYIGVKKPQCEYIYDEDDSIKFVWCFHLYSITK